MRKAIVMKKALTFTLVAMLVLMTMMYAFIVPAKADWNPYVGTYQCAENYTVELQI